MAKKPATGNQLNALPVSPTKLEQISFNMDKQNQFIQSHGVTFIHYRAIPSPIGMKDRGEYRRSDALDTISSNGMIYKQCGEFTAVLLGNGKKNGSHEGNILDQSTGRMTLPQFYDATSPSHAGEPIYLAPGDRVYIKDLEVAVVNYQRVDHNADGDDFLQYPALTVEFLVDSRGLEYKQNVDFCINKHGNIQWIDGKRSPGIDEDTGKGRTFAARYRYNAHWYIASLINEVRVGNITKGGIRQPERLPYHAMIQREYVYHNKINDGTNENKSDDRQPSRVVQEPTEALDPNKYQVKINVNTFTDGEE